MYDDQSYYRQELIDTTVPSARKSAVPVVWDDVVSYLTDWSQKVLCLGEFQPRESSEWPYFEANPPKMRYDKQAALLALAVVR